MAGPSSIEWTEATWNPIVGCSIVSPGCTNCYAMKMAARIEAMGSQPRYAGTTKKVNGCAVWTGKLAEAPESTLTEPLRRKKPTTYFVNSMGDLFHEDCPDEWIDKVFAVMALAPRHTFQVLTKRASRMRQYVSGARDRLIRKTSEGNDNVGIRTATAYHSSTRIGGEQPWPLPNVWLGVSTERQKEADERIPDLLATPAAVRFISAEPLLGPLDLMEVIPNPIIWSPVHGMSRLLDWVIVGGESGADARPMHPDWARSLRDQCAAAGAAFFFKQWGSNIPDEARAGRYRRVSKKAAGRLLDGCEHNAVPGRAA